MNTPVTRGFNKSMAQAPAHSGPLPFWTKNTHNLGMSENKTQKRSTANPSEIAQFARDSAAWWDTDGPFAPLHALNPLRMKFMVNVLTSPSAQTDGPVKMERDPWAKPEGPLSWHHLDVGCGGGLVCEPFARLGARVTGLDADAQAIRIAKSHAVTMNLDIDYHTTTIEKFKETSFNTITALEIIEHVDHPNLFLTELVRCVKPGGIIFISTLNRTVKSLALGKFAAEYILRWVPTGTHDWRKFVKPSELTALMEQNECTPIAATGLCVRPLTQTFYLDPYDLDINYMMAFVKTKK